MAAIERRMVPSRSSSPAFHVTCRLVLMADFSSYIFFTRGEMVATRTIHHGRRSTGTLFTMEDRHPPEPLARVVSSSWSRALRPKNSPISAVFVDLHKMNEIRLLWYRCWCSDATRMDEHEMMVVDPCVDWGTDGIDIGRVWKSLIVWWSFLNEFVCDLVVMIGKRFCGCVVGIVL